MKKEKKNYKIFIGIIIGIILSGGVAYAATVLAATDVSYSNSTSGLTSTTVQGAIDEIYNNAKGGNITYHNTNIVGAYLYDYDKCKTGNEATCRKTACPNHTDKNSCPSGTIIKYKVNSGTTRTFNVLHDDGATMTLQQSENTTSKTAWYTSEDYTKGPITILAALESATSSWSNVNTQTYTMGTTVFNGTNAYTGCEKDSNGNINCTENKYTLGQRSGRARMITVQEALAVGCKYLDDTCPKWMYNNLSLYNFGYWTMSAYYGYWVFDITYSGGLSHYNVSMDSNSARAVVVINK